MLLRIKSLREENGLTQKELAALIHTSNKNIWAYENQIAVPPLEILIEYANHFNVSVDYLLGRTDELGGVVMPSDSPTVPELSAKEREILQLYNSLNPSGKELVDQTLKTLTAASSDKTRKEA